MNKFLLHITSLVALVLFLTMGACNNTPKTPILLEAEGDTLGGQNVRAPPY